MALALQEVCELRGSRRFTRTLKADEHDDVGYAAGKHQLRIGLAQKRRELIQDDLDDVLGGRQGVENLRLEAARLGRGDEFLDHFEIDVRLKQRHAYLAHGRVDILFGQAAFGFQPGKNTLEAIREIVEHVTAPYKRMKRMMAKASVSGARRHAFR